MPCKVLGVIFHLPWTTTSLKRLIKRKQRIYNRAKLYQRDPDWREYKTIRIHVRNILRRQHSNFIFNVMSSAQSDNKKPFWRYLKSRRQDNVGIGTLKTMHVVVVVRIKQNCLMSTFILFSRQRI